MAGGPTRAWEDDGFDDAVPFLARPELRRIAGEGAVRRRRPAPWCTPDACCPCASSHFARDIPPPPHGLRSLVSTVTRWTAPRPRPPHRACPLPLPRRRCRRPDAAEPGDGTRQRQEARTEHCAGVVRPERTAEAEDVFCGCPGFDEAFDRLRADKVVALSGGRDSGRPAAAPVLLHRVGAGTARPRHLACPRRALAGGAGERR